MRDARVAPFIAVSASLQAVRATTVITLAFFLQDTLGLTPAQTVQYSGIGFVTLAVAGLFAQLVLVQRLRPTRAPHAARRRAAGAGGVRRLHRRRTAIRPISSALVLLGIGLGLMRPGSAAGASLSVEANEQGAVAGLVNGVAVLGNVFGPMLGTTLYAISPIGPYVLNAAIMAGAWALLFANRAAHLRM